ncbi:MAG: hypothetical protein PF637_14265 [Spirochaetes bacterium]|jgi:hypothetical protein|nr:hypothetical protein [Spirochaetota bacterium]
MQLYRLASEFIFIECEKPETVKNSLSRLMHVSDENYLQALRKGCEGSTVVFFRTGKTINDPVNSNERVLLIDTDALQIASSLFNMQTRSTILKIHSGPKFIILRYFEYGEADLKKYYHIFRALKKLIGTMHCSRGVNRTQF